MYIKTYCLTLEIIALAKVLEFIAPPSSYYPDFTATRTDVTFGDSAERIRWRQKQNLGRFILLFSKYPDFQIDKFGFKYYTKIPNIILRNTNFQPNSNHT